MPALAPKPKKASAKATVATPGARVVVRKASNSREPAAEAITKNEMAIMRESRYGP